MIKAMQFLNSRSTAILLTLAIFPNIILADSSIDLSEYLEPTNLKKEFSWLTESYDSSGEVKEEYLGSVIETPAGIVEHDGKQYQARLSKTQGLPDYLPSEVKTLQRLSDEGIVEIYVIGTGDLSGDLKDIVIIPADIKEGTSSEPTAHFWETVKTVELVDYESPVGQFENCIKIREFTAELETEGGDEDVIIYCPKIGKVSFTRHLDHRKTNVNALTTITLQSVSEI